MPTRKCLSVATRVALILLVGLFSAACAASVELQPTSEAALAIEAESDDSGRDENSDTNTRPGGPDAFPGGGVDLDKSRDDVDCTAEALGDDFTIDFTVAHLVVDGDLGAVCFGDLDSRLVTAWETLATITPAGQLNDLALFGGFAGGQDNAETTLAFVNTLDDEGTIFQMSINLDEGDAHADELILTMAHEFSHVFTALSTEIDRAVDPESCDTFYNGEGCYRHGSLMAEWIDLFWGDGLIDQIDPYTEPTSASGEERCLRNAGFFGPYAASSPEEDFAEAFSAFVFRVGPDSNEQARKIEWFANQPGLLEFQLLAIDADLGPLPNNFEYCGP